MPQEHGGAIYQGGVPGHRGGNQHTVRARSEELRGEIQDELGRLIADLRAPWGVHPGSAEALDRAGVNTDRPAGEAWDLELAGRCTPGADSGHCCGGGPDCALQEGARPMKGYDSQLAFGVVNLGDTAE